MGSADAVDGGSPAVDSDELSHPWGTYPLPEDEPLTVRIGPLRLHLRAREEEVWIAHEPGEGGRFLEGKARERPEGREKAPLPENPDWIRWPLARRPRGVHLSPVFPDRTVVVESEVPFRLLKGARARVFVRVPLWVRVTLEAGDDTPLTSVPTVVLSDTWWGGFKEGELCYWLGTTARRHVSPDVFAPHLAVCPLQLVNRSSEELPVERIAVRVAHLSVFSEEGNFWSDESRVRFRGADEGSEIELAGTRPSEAPEARKVAGPREPPPGRRLRVFGMARLLDLAGMGEG